MNDPRKLFFVLSALMAFFSACSFNYGDAGDSGDAIPEMVLSDVSASRYEDSRLSMTLSAKTLEIYDTDKIWAGEGISFEQYESSTSGTLEASGRAGLLLVDNADEIYYLGQDAEFHYYPDNLGFRAEDLRWAKKTHLLCSSLSGDVEIVKSDGSTIRGTGFFADTLARAYEFSSPVSGKLSNGSELTKPSMSAKSIQP